MTTNSSSLALQDLAPELRGEWAPGSALLLSFEPSCLEALLLSTSCESLSGQASTGPGK